MSVDTRDSIELGHFKNLSSTWWDEQGPFQTLHAITPHRMAFIKEKISIHFRCSDISLQPLEGLRILDVGCGGGLLCEPLARLGAKVTGIDPLEDNIFSAKKHAEAMGLSINYHPWAIEDLPQDFSPFDVVIASEMIEHVVHPDDFLKVCVKHLKSQGAMIITTLNRTLKSYILGILAAEYILGWAPRGTHSWKKFITPEDLSQKLKNLGLNHQDISGLYFSPLQREWRLGPFTDVNYFLWAARS